MKRTLSRIALVLLCAGSAFSYTGSGGSGGGGSSGPALTSVNALPAVVSFAYSNAGSAATIAATAPSSISNGNALVAMVQTTGLTAANWTVVPAGFNHIGTQIVQTATSKETVDVWCKVAASESGAYTFTENTGSSNLINALIVNISGASCTADGTPSQTSTSAQTLALSAITTTTKASDIVLIESALATGGASSIVLPSNATGLRAVGSTYVNAYYYFNGAGNTPAAQVNYSSNDDIGAIMIALPASVTSTQTAVTNSNAGNLSSLNLTNGIDNTGGTIQSPTFMVTGMQPSSTSLTNSYAGPDPTLGTANGYLIPWLAWSGSNSLNIDPAERFTSVTIGSGASTGQDALFIQRVGINIVSPDSLQDIPVLGSNSHSGAPVTFYFGCVGGGTCNSGGNEAGDNIFGTNNGQTFHLCFDNSAVSSCADAMSLTATAMTLPTGGPILNAQNGVQNGCSGVITLAAGVGNSVVAANSNTGTGANLAGTCIKNYTKIACIVAPNVNVGAAPATPANTPGVVNCFASPTATATAGMAATATQTAIYAVASTANATYTVLWWGQY